MSVLPLIVVAGAFALFAVVSVLLAIIDLRTHRLPDRLVLPAYLVAITLFALAALLGAGWMTFLRAILGMAALFACYFVLRLVAPAGMGGGDVKLAGLIGLHLAWIGWTALAVGAIAGFVLGGLYGVILLVSGRAGRRTRIAFGPWMLGGAWCGIFVGVAMAGGVATGSGG